MTDAAGKKTLWIGKTGSPCSRSLWREQLSVCPCGCCLALTLPVVDAQRLSGFFDPDTPFLSDNTVAQYRSAFLHYMEYHPAASDDELSFVW